MTEDETLAAFGRARDPKLVDVTATLAGQSTAEAVAVGVGEDELMKAAEGVFDGWYADARRIDWEDFLDRLEAQTDVDLGKSLDSPLIRRIKKHVTAYRKLDT
jgi:hypothetical protein